MKIKWLIILLIFFLGVISLSLLITQQNQRVVSLSEKEIPITEQADNRAPLVYPSQVRLAPIVVLPNGGITIIKAPPAITPQEENNSTSKIADRAINNVPSQNVKSSTQVKDSLPIGITKIGKQPTHKEAQEMNSTGIVLY